MLLGSAAQGENLENIKFFCESYEVSTPQNRTKMPEIGRQSVKMYPMDDEQQPPSESEQGGCCLFLAVKGFCR